MARLLNLELTKSYATHANAVKAVEKFNLADNLTYLVHRDEESGRYFPIFIGERAIQAGVHFRFHVVA